MKFGRYCRVEFVNLNIPAITDLRIQFDVDKFDGINFNHATLSIWNMSENSRMALARVLDIDDAGRLRPPRPPIAGIRLFAGYEDNAQFMFGGDIQTSISSRIGPDWITKIELYTDLYRATAGITQESFATPTPARTILEAIIKPLGVAVRYTDEAAQILEGKIRQDYSCSGYSYREAHEFVRSYGLAFTIEEQGQGLVYVPTRPRDPNSVQNSENTISADNGLIGTPQIQTSGISLQTLLRPQTKLFEKIYVQSETTTGTLKSSTYAAEYFVSHVRHSGDTRGDDWFTEIEGFYARLGKPIPI